MLRRLPPLNALKSFDAAARHESFTRAAEELCVTQGAVSHQVKALEGELGIKLFHRERQRLVRERTGHLNRIKALLITHGVRTLRITDAKWCERLDKMRTGDGRSIPTSTSSRLRAWASWALI